MRCETTAARGERREQSAERNKTLPIPKSDEGMMLVSKRSLLYLVMVGDVLVVCWWYDVMLAEGASSN